jgi:3-hydroxyisobutyrate dehydrogenase-like beta-hydroxyacid dehydrogenase
MGLAIEAAKVAGAPVGLGASAHEVYKMLSNSKEYSGKDFSSVFKWLGRTD